MAGDIDDASVQSSAQEDGSATPSKDEAIIADAKSALQACLVF
jgi:proton-dependent oligopeptide transporter, POT family